MWWGNGKTAFLGGECIVIKTLESNLSDFGRAEDAHSFYLITIVVEISILERILPNVQKKSQFNIVLIREKWKTT